MLQNLNRVHQALIDQDVQDEETKKYQKPQNNIFEVFYFNHLVNI
jgi:hypothetical protein